MTEKVELTKKVILSQIQKNNEKIKSFGVKNMWLFGSYAKDEQKKGSDIDFLVEFVDGRGLFDDFFGLLNYLENKFKRKVDIGKKHLIREELKKYINIENSLRCEI